MKKILIVVAALAVFATSCKNERRTALSPETLLRDSLQSIIDQKDSEVNSMMETLNQIQEGFREIALAENRVSIAKDGERTDKAQQIREDIKIISNTMKTNRELIEKLRQQLRESIVKADGLKEALESMVKQLEDKDKQLVQLRSELDSKDIHIAELDETINNLNSNVEDLTAESKEKTNTINAQDKQLNTAWFVFGTKKELKEQHILDSGDRVLQSNFNNSYFTKIDIRVEKEIKFYSKSARLLTMHPSSSYTLQQDANKQYILRITNPQLFWSTSKYLVILVK